MAVPPLAETPRLVLLETEPPSTDTPPTVSPTPMALPTLPPLLMLPRLTAPPLAPAVATPPLPADAVNCAKRSSFMSMLLPCFPSPPDSAPTKPATTMIVALGRSQGRSALAPLRWRGRGGDRNGGGRWHGSRAPSVHAVHVACWAPCSC